MRVPLVYDGRNVYRVEDMRDAGVEYYSIGRKSSLTSMDNILDLRKELSQNLKNKSIGGGKDVKGQAI